MKKHELTQEQIEKLAEKKHAKELLKEFLPEAFENKLEVGKWYRLRNKAFNWLMCYTENRNGCYGFNSENLYSNEYVMYDYNDWKLATEEEVREALINEAKKRYTNKKARCLDTNDIIKINFNELTYYEDINGLYAFDDDLDTEIEIFKDGIWAEIIEEKNTFDKDYLDNKITEIYSLLGDIKQYVKQLENEN